MFVNLKKNCCKNKRSTKTSYTKDKEDRLNQTFSKLTLNAFSKIKDEQCGRLLLAGLQLKPACVWVCEFIHASVRLSSWTTSQIRDLCLMSSWDEQRQHAEHHMTFTSWAGETERVTARWSETGGTFLSRLIVLLFLYASLSPWSTEMITEYIKVEINCERWQGRCVFLATSWLSFMAVLWN